MKNLFETTRVNEVKERLSCLRHDSDRQWGRMQVAQAAAYCTAGFELALGERLPPRLLVGRIIGGLIKPKVLNNDEPMRRNSPTVPGLVMSDDRNLETERLYEMIDRFAAEGLTGCTTHPHSFFGRLTPDEWATLMYKHMDHHLRQFGA